MLACISTSDPYSYTREYVDWENVGRGPSCSNSFYNPMHQLYIAMLVAYLGRRVRCFKTSEVHFIATVTWNKKILTHVHTHMWYLPRMIANFYKAGTLRKLVQLWKEGWAELNSYYSFIHQSRYLYISLPDKKQPNMHLIFFNVK